MSNDENLTPAASRDFGRAARGVTQEADAAEEAVAEVMCCSATLVKPGRTALACYTSCVQCLLFGFASPAILSPAYLMLAIVYLAPDLAVDSCTATALSKLVVLGSKIALIVPSLSVLSCICCMCAWKAALPQAALSRKTSVIWSAAFCQWPTGHVTHDSMFALSSMADDPSCACRLQKLTPMRDPNAPAGTAIPHANPSGRPR